MTKMPLMYHESVYRASNFTWNGKFEEARATLESRRKKFPRESLEHAWVQNPILWIHFTTFQVQVNIGWITSEEGARMKALDAIKTTESLIKGVCSSEKKMVNLKMRMEWTPNYLVRVDN